jgi:hypothetical protein
MPYQHRRQPRPYALQCEALHLILDFRLDRSGNCISIQNSRHAPSFLLMVNAHSPGEELSLVI